MKDSVSRRRLIVTVAVLILAAAAGIYYKIAKLKFSVLPEKGAALWQIEERITFTATPGDTPIKVSLAAPENHPGFKVFSLDQLSDDMYHFQLAGLGDQRRAEWLAPPSEGRQVILLRLKIFDTVTSGDTMPAPAPELGPKPFWREPITSAMVERALEFAARGAEGKEEIVLRILRMVYRPDDASGIKHLLPAAPTAQDRVELAIDLLRELEIPARPVSGMQLIDGRRRNSVVRTLDVYLDGAWHGYDVEKLQPGFPPQFVALRRGGRSLLDVEGGSESSVRFSTSVATVPASVLISARADKLGRTLGSLSIYDLPVDSQNMFMRIALIPVGLLIVVLVRNIIGVQTMGTFMPVLIAMAFTETTLVPGLVSFLIIVGVGLLFRFYMDNLNLLLVPRIAAVVLVVIYLMKAYSMVSHEFGFTQGLSVTFFPLIIIAWTIERASILWEEDGPVNTLKQFGASLGTGVLCYLAIANPYVRHIAFSFAEIDLFILALVLLIGSYTGYRLTELRRFRSLVKK